MSEAITIPDTGTTEIKVSAVTDGIRSVRIENEADYRLAVAYRASNKMLTEEVNATFDPLIKQANALVATIRATKSRFSTTLDNNRLLIDGKLASYERRVELERIEAETRLANEMTAQDEKRRKEEVRLLEKTGSIKAAKQLEVAPLPPPVVPVLPSAVPRVDGLSKRTLWEAQLTDLNLLVRAVCAGDAPLELLQLNQPMANQIARSRKSTLRIPGLVAVSKEVRSQRT